MFFKACVCKIKSNVFVDCVSVLFLTKKKEKHGQRVAMDGCNGGALRTNVRTHAQDILASCLAVCVSSSKLPNEMGRPSRHSTTGWETRGEEHGRRPSPPTEPSVTTPRALAGTRRQGSNSTNSESDSYKINNISINVLYMREDESEIKN